MYNSGDWGHWAWTLEAESQMLVRSGKGRLGGGEDGVCEGSGSARVRDWLISASVCEWELKWGLGWGRISKDLMYQHEELDCASALWSGLAPLKRCE